MVNKKNNLLICAQKLNKNDDLLGFFHGWAAEFARQYETVTVVCLLKGEVDLPGNVRVLSLGKENLEVRSKNLEFRSFKGLLATCYRLRARITYFFLFYKYIWKERKNYDAVFVHMNPIYVLLGGVFWRVLGKRIGLWYAHGHVPWELRVAEKLVHVIFTSTVGGCRVESGKVRVVGQGVGLVNYELRSMNYGARLASLSAREGVGSSVLRLITIGRIAKVKDLESLIFAVEVLAGKGLDAKLKIVGGIGLEKEREYYDSLLDLVKEKKLESRVEFVGAVPNTKIVQHLAEADIFVSASRTGSLDKVFLEAILCGLPVVACNDALLEVIRGYEDKLFYPTGDYAALAERIEGLLKMPAEDIEEMLEELRGVVGREHGVSGLVERIANNF